MTKIRQTFNQWFTSRKMFLLIAYWAFAFIGAAILYFVNAKTFEDCMTVYNNALEWALWGFLGFAGVEGGKEIMGIARGNRKPNTDYNPTNTEIV